MSYIIVNSYLRRKVSFKRSKMNTLKADQKCHHVLKLLFSRFTLNHWEMTYFRQFPSFCRT